MRSLEVDFQARQSDLVDASLTAHLNLTDGSLAGSAPTLQPVSASVSRDGYPVASGECLPIPDPAGFFYYFTLVWQPYPCGGDYCYPEKLEPGDQVYLTQGSLSQSLSVPLLTALAEPGAAPPGEDSLYGQAPPASELTASVIPFPDPAALYTQTANIAGDGSYQISLAPAHDLHRQDSGYVLVELSPGASIYRRFVAPMLRLQVGGAAISGVAVPQADIILTHTLASGQVVEVIHTDTSKYGGFFHRTEVWEWEAGSPSLAPGDRLLASAGGQVFSMTLPVLTANTHQATGQISGQAPPGAAVEVHYFDGPIPLDSLMSGYVDAIWDLEPFAVAVTSATPGGEYTASLPVQTGDYGAAFISLPDEHQAYARTTTFYIYTRLADLSDYWSTSILAGQIDLLLSPITVSVRGPSGYLKDWQVGTTSGAGGFGYFGPWWDIWPKIDSGDVVEIAAPGEELLAFSVPILTASANRNLSDVSGTAPPETRLTVSVHDVYPQVTRVVTSTTGGAYYADFSNSLEFSYYSNGTVRLATPEGHQVDRPWRISGCPPYLHGAQVGGNRVFVNVETNCYDGMMRLWDASGKLKKEVYLYEIQYGSYETPEFHLFDESGVPIPVLPGDRIDVSISRQLVAFFTRTALPRLVIPIYSDAVYGWLPPLTPYQLRASGPDTAASASGYITNDAYLYAYLFSDGYGDTRIKPGDHLELETPQGVDELTIPELTARYDLPAARLSGLAPPSALLDVMISGQFPDGYSTDLIRQTSAGADGEYHVDFPELAGSQNVQGSLIYHSPAEHQVTLAFATPRLELTLDGLCAYGIAPYPSGAITLTVTSADGSYQRTASQSAKWGSFDICFERGFAAGDQLVLSDADSVLLQYLVSDITARHDYHEQVLLGSAPPGSRPSVQFDTEIGIITRYPLLESDGSFGIDTSNLPFGIGYSGWVTVGDLLGNLTHRNFTISGCQVRLPLVIQL